MKKKLLTLILCLCFIVPAMFVFGACSKDPENFTVTYDYGKAGDLFEIVKSSDTITSTDSLMEIPEVKDEYKDAFKGWFISGTDEQIENNDIIDKNITVEARFYHDVLNMSGLYQKGKYVMTWAEIKSNCSGAFADGEDIIISGDDGFYIWSYFESIKGELVIDKTVTQIDWYAFIDCSGLTSVVIPNSITSIGAMSFNGCSALENIIVEQGNPVYDSRNNCNAIIETDINELIVGCKNTIIPNSVTTIGTAAFSGCSGLTNITIPSSVTSIMLSVFSGCDSLTSLVVEEGNPVYDSRNNCNAIIETSTNTLFLGCKNTIIPNGVTSIGWCAFESCEALTSIEIPNGITTIGVGAFLGCSSLTSIEIPNSVTSISSDSFASCDSLTSLVVEEGNPVYDSRDNCNAIIETSTNTLLLGCKNTIIPNSVTSIGDNAFASCYSLVSIEIPNSVTTIGWGAFWGCDSLESISLPNGLTSIDEEAFGYCTSLVNISIPSSVESICWNAFWGCESLESIVIPNSVTFIDDGAFADCISLKSVTILGDATSIGADVFINCFSLKEVILDSETIVNELTSYDSCGGLILYAETIYTKSGINIDDETCLPLGYTKQATSNKMGYDMWVKN